MWLSCWCHLHFYLSTKFQVPDSEVINYWHLRKLLQGIYLVPKFPTGYDEDEAEETSSDGIEWEEDDEDDEDDREVDDDDDEPPAKKARGKKASAKKATPKKAAAMRL